MSSLIYHWTTPEKATTALANDRLSARRWKHFIEEVGQMLSGTSWSSDPVRWRADNEVCLVLDSSKIENSRYDIPGSRTYWLTQGMLNPGLYDPEAYQYEPDEIDEAFIAGTIKGLRSAIVSVKTDNDSVSEIARMHGLDVDPLPSNKNRMHP